MITVGPEDFQILESNIMVYTMYAHIIIITSIFSFLFFQQRMQIFPFNKKKQCIRLNFTSELDLLLVSLVGSKINQAASFSAIRSHRKHVWQKTTTVPNYFTSQPPPPKGE